MLIFCYMLIVFLVFTFNVAVGQFQGGFLEFDSDSDGVYRGKYIGSLNTYHHQVSGEVYAVDTSTFLIKDFVYDGTGRDTFFWAGGSNVPGSSGFIIANEYGRTNVLYRYSKEEITIRLPDGKSINDIRWFSIYDLSLRTSFGDIDIPEEFLAPGPQTINDIFGNQYSIRSARVIIMDSKTIKIPNFNYDGRGGEGIHFWVGIGPQPSSKGTLVPNELGYTSASLRVYKEEDVVIELPGRLTIFDIRWFAIYDTINKRDLGHVIIPDGMNVPPALIDIIDHRQRSNNLPNCEMLHKDVMVSWDIFGAYITMEIAGYIGDDEYIAVGFNKENKASMVNSDAAVAYIDGYLGLVDDYNITAKALCGGGVAKGGVCRDSEVGGNDNLKAEQHSRMDGITSLTFRRSLETLGDPGDASIRTDGYMTVIWAVGRLTQRGRKKEPTFHRLFPKNKIEINFGRNPAVDNCGPFVIKRKSVTAGVTLNSWGPFHIYDPSIRTFDARLGPSGGLHGASSITGFPMSGLVWYINGYMVPELYLRRGFTYAFRVEGGNDPYSREFYHPFVISSEAAGGFERLSDEQRSEIRILAGVVFTRRGAVRPTATGRLCLWKHDEMFDSRLDFTFSSFEQFRNSLHLKCNEGRYAVLEVTPNSTWPNVVYYQSYTQPFMGWKINIVDNFEHSIPFNSVSLSATNNPKFGSFFTLIILFYKASQII